MFEWFEGLYFFFYSFWCFITLNMIHHFKLINKEIICNRKAKKSEKKIFTYTVTLDSYIYIYILTSAKYKI